MSKGKLQAASVVLVANLVLLIIKGFVVLMTGSIAVAATLLDSLFDLAGGVFIYLGVRRSGAPRDASHHYGHKQYENLYSLGQLALIALTAIIISFESARRLLNPEPFTVGAFELAIMLFTIIIDIGLFAYLQKESDEHGGSALEAAEKNYLSDILQNSAVFVGLTFVSFGFMQADSIAALVVAGFMLRVVYKASKQPVRELVDASPPRRKMSKIREVIREYPGVLGYENLRARMADGQISVDVRIEVDGSMPLRKARKLAESLEEKVKYAVSNVKEVLVETHPAD